LTIPQLKLVFHDYFFVLIPKVFFNQTADSQLHINKLQLICLYHFFHKFFFI